MHNFGGSDVKVGSIDAEKQGAFSNFVENRELCIFIRAFGQKWGKSGF